MVRYNILDRNMIQVHSCKLYELLYPKDDEPHQFFIISIYLIKKPTQMYETLHELSCKSRLDFYTRNTENEHQSALLKVYQYLIESTYGPFLGSDFYFLRGCAHIFLLLLGCNYSSRRKICQS